MPGKDPDQSMSIGGSIAYKTIAVSPGEVSDIAALSGEGGRGICGVASLTSE